eukprot:gene1350-1431_t
MWTTEVNDIKILENFVSLIDKDQAPTKGDFSKDYNSFCEGNGIIRCPYITSYLVDGDNNKEGIRIANGIIDLPSWRAFLLALVTAGSKIFEVQIHSCSLSPAHLQDLGKALSKHGLAKSLKIQYSELFQSSDDPATVVSSIKSIFSEATNLEYISLKNNQLTDDIIKGFAPALTENYRLTTVNLSQNNLSDDAATAVLQAVKFNPNYRIIILSDNAISGSGVFNAVLTQYIGALNTPNEDAAIKANTKSLNDRNKAVKDLNKKRKKANLLEFNEFPAFPEFTKAYEGKTQYFANRMLEYLDLTGNPLEAAELVNLSNGVSNLPANTLPDVKIKVLLNPIDADEASVDKIRSFTEFL